MAGTCEGCREEAPDEQLLFLPSPSSLFSAFPFLVSCPRPAISRPGSLSVAAPTPGPETLPSSISASWPLPVSARTPCLPEAPGPPSGGSLLRERPGPCAFPRTRVCQRRDPVSQARVRLQPDPSQLACNGPQLRRKFWGVSTVLPEAVPGRSPKGQNLSQEARGRTSTSIKHRGRLGILPSSSQTHPGCVILASEPANIKQLKEDHTLDFYLIKVLLWGQGSWVAQRMEQEDLSSNLAQKLNPT
ncbi:uncharacterized protein LOC127541704 [Antechinus flavipes]|uniref:uncharacterized protein LOC127541704 n=1 Tax=Antechinus flavipes TaxID=38775 RepID=UPI00223625BB|nr:uncharacterized protein LOC127541704 [Antechinus flavipes]